MRLLCAIDSVQVVLPPDSGFKLVISFADSAVTITPPINAPPYLVDFKTSFPAVQLQISLNIVKCSNILSTGKIWILGNNFTNKTDLKIQSIPFLGLRNAFLSASFCCLKDATPDPPAFSLLKYKKYVIRKSKLKMSNGAHVFDKPDFGAGERRTGLRKSFVCGRRLKSLGIVGPGTDTSVELSDFPAQASLGSVQAGRAMIARYQRLIKEQIELTLRERAEVYASIQAEREAILVRRRALDAQVAEHRHVLAEHAERMRQSEQRRAQLITDLHAIFQAQQSKLGELRASRLERRKHFVRVEFAELWAEVEPDVARFMESVATVKQSDKRCFAMLTEAVRKGEEAMLEECGKLDVVPVTLLHGQLTQMSCVDLTGKWQQVEQLCQQLVSSIDRAKSAKSIDPELINEVKQALAFFVSVDNEIG
jgi:hypothetical protein